MGNQICASVNPDTTAIIHCNTRILMYLELENQICAIVISVIKSHKLDSGDDVFLSVLHWRSTLLKIQF